MAFPLLLSHSVPLFAVSIRGIEFSSRTKLWSVHEFHYIVSLTSSTADTGSWDELITPHSTNLEPRLIYFIFIITPVADYTWIERIFYSWLKKGGSRDDDLRILDRKEKNPRIGLMFDSILVVLWGPSIFMSYENSSIILFVRIVFFFNKNYSEQENVWFEILVILWRSSIFLPYENSLEWEGRREHGSLYRSF